MGNKTPESDSESLSTERRMKQISREEEMKDHVVPERAIENRSCKMTFQFSCDLAGFPAILLTYNSKSCVHPITIWHHVKFMFVFKIIGRYFNIVLLDTYQCRCKLQFDSSLPNGDIRGFEVFPLLVSDGNYFPSYIPHTLITLIIIIVPKFFF